MKEKVIRINQQLNKLLSTLQQEQQVDFLLHFQEAVECEFKKRAIIFKLDKIVENSNLDKNYLTNIQRHIFNPELSLNGKNNLIKMVKNYIAKKLEAVMESESLTVEFAEAVDENNEFVASDTASSSESSENDNGNKSQSNKKRKKESKVKKKSPDKKADKTTAHDLQIIQAAQAFQRDFHASSSNTSKLQKVIKSSSKNKYGYLQYIMRIKPDASCENTDQKEAFGEQVKTRLMQPPYQLNLLGIYSPPLAA